MLIFLIFDLLELVDITLVALVFLTKLIFSRLKLFLVHSLNLFSGVFSPELFLELKLQDLTGVDFE